ncbi:hypothetical protein OAC51_03930 [Flavobacteriaceae bacterium]|nr:hypothetical protein [Flavobacteriaceae bacterium]
MDLNKYFDLFKLLNFYKALTISSFVIAIFSISSAFGYSYYLNNLINKDYIYVLDSKGGAFVASIMNDGMGFRSPEIHHHLLKFHSLFYDIDQNNYQYNIDKALNLIGEDGKHFFITLDKSGWFKSIKMNNLKQSINIEKIEIDDKKYPYEAKVFGMTKVERIGGSKSSHQKEYIANLTLINVDRSIDNPHGLMIEQYEIVKHE